jgi:hypothetical protein
VITIDCERNFREWLAVGTRSTADTFQIDCCFSDNHDRPPDQATDAVVVAALVGLLVPTC